MDTQRAGSVEGGDGSQARELVVRLLLRWIYCSRSDLVSTEDYRALVVRG